MHKTDAQFRHGYVDFAQPLRASTDKENMRTGATPFTIRNLTPDYVVLEFIGHEGQELGRLEMHLAVVEEEAGSVCWWMNYAGDFVVRQHVGRA